MNITPHINHVPVATAVNPPTDHLRRENMQRPVITAPSQTSGSPAEKSTADKHKASGQPGEQFNFTELQKSAEKNSNQINGNSEQEHHESSADQQNNQENDQSDIEGENGVNTFLEKNSAEALQDEEVIQQLKLRDQEVRAHELAHASVGGVHTGSPSYEFQIGPDGKKYAVGGEVSVDLSPVSGDPRATISKMEKVHAAALAPAEPSAQDFKVAAQASELILQAKADLSELALEESERKNQPSKASPYIEPNDVFNAENNAKTESLSFDEQINQTLKAQEEIAPSLSNDVKERSLRIEGYYSGITQAYEKSPSHQFEITV